MIDSKTFDKFAQSPAEFRNALIVDVDGEPKRFGDVMDDWQREDFAALDPGLKKCNGRSKAKALTRAYLERGRGHSKTTDIGVTSTWCLAFSTRPLKGYCYAADRDQAALLRQAIETLLRLNPWLGEILEVTKDRVTVKAAGHPGEGGYLQIETSDVASSYGILPDLIVADELTHWQGDGSLWHSLISSAAKRSNCLMLVISNAGFADSWQWNVREAARTDEGWYFSRLDGPQASWMTPERLAEQRRMLPAVAYSRLWENLWSSGGGDALTPEDIARAFDKDLGVMTGSAAERQVWAFYGGVDLGLTRDGSAVVILAFGRHGGPHAGKIRLAHAKLWRPSAAIPKIDLMEVERQINALDIQFNLERLAVDPWQAELLARRLEMDVGRRSRTARLLNWQRPWIEQVQPTGQNLNKIASLVVETFHDGVFRGYEYEPLRRDLLKLRVIEKSYGIRLESPRDEHGHGDVYSAWSLALYLGHAETGKKPVIAGVPKDTSTTSTRMDRAMARIDRENALRRAEYEDLLKGRVDDNELYRRFLGRCGR